MTTTHTLAPGWTLTHTPEVQCVKLRGPGPGQYTCTGPDAPDHHGRLWYALGLELAASAGVAATVAPELGPQAVKQLIANNLACVKAGIARLTEWRDSRRRSWCADADDALIRLQSAAVGLEMIAAAPAAPQVAAAGELPASLTPVHKEWYTLCERAPHAEKITISGKLAEAIVNAVSVAPQVAAAPAGYKLVPVEPTEEMHVAAVRTIVRCTGNADFPPRVWRAMCAAAPEVAAPQPRPYPVVALPPPHTKVGHWKYYHAHLMREYGKACVDADRAAQAACDTGRAGA